MLVPDACLLKLLPVALLIHICKYLKEAAIICLQDGVLGGQVQWPACTLLLLKLTCCPVCSVIAESCFAENQYQAAVCCTILVI